MCGRFALKAPPAQLILQFGLDECAEFSPRYNIAPGTEIPVIRLSPEGKRVLHLLRWGLIPHWTKDQAKAARPINARGESLSEKPMFKEAFKKRRCLIPADGFYEWKSEGKTKQPYYFSLKSEEPMALAGLWESWKAPDGSILRTVCVITTEANAVMTPVHHRMPVIIQRESWRDWLEAPVEAVEKLVAPSPDAMMQGWRVDRRVSNAADDDAHLIELISS